MGELPENYPFESYRPRGWNPISDNYEPISLKIPKDLPESEKRKIYQTRVAELKRQLLAPREPREPEAYSLTHNTGVRGKFVQRHESDQINIGRPYRDQVVLEYLIESPGTPKYYPLLTNGNIEDAPHRIVDKKDASKADKNVPGRMIAEPEARSILEHWLTNYLPHGKVLPLLPPGISPAEREGYLVRNNENYTLKVKYAPNLILLRQRKGIPAWGDDIKENYQEIAEIDGFFRYQLRHKEHIIVMESKLGGFNTNPDLLLFQMFMPLGELYPRARFTYALFLPEELMFADKELRILTDRPVKIYRTLREAGISTLLFTFPESKEDYRQHETHILNQHRMMRGMEVTYPGRVVRHGENWKFYNGSPTPLVGFSPSGIDVDLYRRTPSLRQEPQEPEYCI